MGKKSSDGNLSAFDSSKREGVDFIPEGCGQRNAPLTVRWRGVPGGDSATFIVARDGD
jgi:hypothetical protein